MLEVSVWNVESTIHLYMRLRGNKLEYLLSYVQYEMNRKVLYVQRATIGLPKKTTNLRPHLPGVSRTHLNL